MSSLSGLFTGALNPSDIDGLEMWLKAEVGAFQDSAKIIPALDDGDVIGTWKDQLGNGNDATQETTANKPLLNLSRWGVKFYST